MLAIQAMHACGHRHQGGRVVTSDLRTFATPRSVDARLVLSADPPAAQLAYAFVVVRDVARSLWAEPRAPNPPPPQWWDWALVAALVPATILEGVLRDDLAWRPVSIAMVVVVAPALLWRRSHPLLVAVLAFGTCIAVDVASLVAGVTWEGLNVHAFMIMVIYALFRWGSGREALIGVTLPLAALFLSIPDGNTVGDLVGGALMVLFVSALGAAFRYRGTARLRGRDQARLREREQLARELHDTVAHHVSAIAIQAQAGRTVADSHPEAVLDALVVVEKEASRALTEMRTIVGALRRGEESDLGPQPGVADIERLARSNGNPPRVDVTLTGDLADLPPSVDAALYRLAQESVTNALRHARHATHVQVVVTGDGDSVRLTVWDDGDARPAAAGSSSGFGLLGMAERARLLGGTLEAGPGRDHGWTVVAELPRRGAMV
jgi:signal transduction histidine kinase